METRRRKVRVFQIKPSNYSFLLFGFLFFLVIKRRLEGAHAQWGPFRQTRRERREWEERGRTTKSCGCLSGAWLPTTHPGACKPATLLDYTRIYSLKAHEENYSSLFSTHSRSDRWVFSLFRRHFSDKMADTPLPQRSASCAQTLPITANSSRAARSLSRQRVCKHFSRGSARLELFSGAS